MRILSALFAPGLVLLGSVTRAGTGAAGGGGFAIPPDCSMSFGAASPVGSGQVSLSGYVDIECNGTRIQADTVLYDTRTKRGIAEGAVVLDWGANRVTGSHLEFDLSNQTGTMTEATGWIEPEAVMSARVIRKLDEEHVLLEKGVFTTCTQPTPYWSFRVGRGLFHLGHYAHLRNVRLNVGRVPVLYIPWMLWPIKGDRAAGFLLPQWGTSKKYGFFVGEAFFWPFVRSADVTLYGDYYALGGPAGGIEANWLPNERGRVRITGYYLKDNERDERRYTERLQLQQGLGASWRLAADLNDVSDFRYYQDFERNLATASANSTLSAVNLVHNGEYASFNVKAKNRKQFFTEESEFISTLESQLTLGTLPEIELRGRSRRLPGTPLYFSFDSSAAYLRRNSEDFAPDGKRTSHEEESWARVDLTSGLAMPLRPSPWLAFEPRALIHETYYTAERDPVSGQIDDTRDVGRKYYELQAQLVGPKLNRVFASSSVYSSSYKNVIEPRLLYRFVPLIEEQDRVPLFDQRDAAARQVDLSSDSSFNDPRVASDSDCRDLRASPDDKSLNHSCVTLSVGTRLLAKRPPAVIPETARPTEGSATGGALPWSSFPTPIEVTPPPLPASVSPETAEKGEQAPAGPIASKPPSSEQNPVEIANLELIQSYSFTNPLSILFREKRACEDGTDHPPCANGQEPETVVSADGTRRYGPLALVLHFNPAVFVSVDLRSEYDLLNGVLTSNSLSGWYRWRSGYVNATYSRQHPVGSPGADSSQIRLGPGVWLFNRKLTLDGDLGYDLTRSATLDARGRAGYYTQCCGFVVEYLKREFEGNQRREFRFVLDLKGIGKLLDLGGVGSR